MSDLILGASLSNYTKFLGALNLSAIILLGRAFNLISRGPKEGNPSCLLASLWFQEIPNKLLANDHHTLGIWSKEM